MDQVKTHFDRRNKKKNQHERQLWVKLHKQPAFNDTSARMVKINGINDNVNEITKNLVNRRRHSTPTPATLLKELGIQIKEEVSVCPRSETTVVRGADIGDIPTCYSIAGVLPSEFPVIGTYVDQRIVPGFRYRVRQLDRNGFLFKEKALQLLSIGMGYGKRITFKDESPRKNEKYFWSDSCASGYAFSIESIAPGDKFAIKNSNDVDIGVANILDTIGPHRELKTRVLNVGVLEKEVEVTFTCSVFFVTKDAGVVSMHSGRSIEVSGVVTLRRQQGYAPAAVVSIRNLKLPISNRNYTFVPN